MTYVHLPERLKRKCGCEFKFRNSPSKSERGKFCSRSCGNSVTSLRHGHAKESTGQSPTYTTYMTMLQRCNNEKNVKYPAYGGVGISVCERWRTSFANFLADMGERPEGTTIDRFPDKSGNYEPGNCRWSTIDEQQQNLKNNRLITSGGRTMCASEWARELGVLPSVILYRINHGWSADNAVSTPPKYGNRVKARQFQLLSA